MAIAAPFAPSTPGGAGSGPRPGPRRRPGEFGGGGRKFTPRRKVCQFCVDKVKEVDYKDLGRLRRFLSDRGKIEPRRKTGTCAGHQRSLNVALKRARHLALLPFTAEHIRVTGVAVREPGSSFRGPRPRPAEGIEPAAPEAPAADGAVEAPQGVAAPAGDGTVQRAAGTPPERVAAGTPPVETATPLAEAATQPTEAPPQQAQPAPAAATEAANGAPSSSDTPEGVAESSSAAGAREASATGPTPSES